VKLFHVADWLQEKIVDGKWALMKRSEKFTYHDPSSLARFTDIHESPRAILQSIFGRQPLEMFANRRKACSCGESGGMLLTNPEIAREAAARRYQQAVSTGAELLITCAHLLSGVPGGTLRVMDLVELVAEAL
jgi:Fe-S oxidoreductase